MVAATIETETMSNTASTTEATPTQTQVVLSNGTTSTPAPSEGGAIGGRDVGGVLTLLGFLLSLL